MDYRMIHITAAANENIVDIISKHLNEQGWHNAGLKLCFVGFEAPGGTQFYLNHQKDPIKVPSSGAFVTPFDGNRYMKIFSLKFVNGFDGDIYFIV